jgi:hypothetical protein
MKKQKLYSYQNEFPEPLPNSMLINDLMYTDLQNLSDDELNKLGFSGPFYVPDGFNASKKVVWNPNTQVLSLIDLTLEEKMESEPQKWDNVRNIRNKLLSESDWIVLKSIENDEIVPKEYSEYREELRNIPQKFNYSWEVSFPSFPIILETEQELEIPTDDELMDNP